LSIPAGVTLYDARDPDVLQAVHQALMSALTELDGYFAEHGIEYWVDGGALLGLVRHGELIAWDDDIDLAMDRDNFIKLRDVARGGIPRGLRWCTPESDPRIPEYQPGRFRLSGTAAIELAHLRRPEAAPSSLGLSIDIWPFDEIPRGRVARRVTNRMRLEHHLAELVRTEQFDAGRSLRRRAHGAVLSRCSPKLFLAAQRVVTRLGEGSGVWGFGLETGWGYLQLPADVIWPLGTGNLSGVSVPVPANLDKYLRQHYGPSYLVPPDEHQRLPHTRFVGLGGLNP
jgi:lipopolysaccharide cholinephosphotransferase